MRKAIDVAERYLLGDSSEHMACLVEVARHMDKIVHDPAVDKAEKSLNRLIWCALVTNTELSGYACEFVVGLGEDIGLELDVMTEIVVHTVPGMAEWCEAHGSSAE
ncbi:hypothetical protein IM816_08635 [Luteibacter flocculans]|uniref:Uncharacterized protein n=1 Tax=Luteibacter flocculans TaxID=2780091 RepID=A0ABY4T8D9_9GAMM|nr:hypothetical protein [Luteibacter flocculans]URL60127.1 hypothetical protein IM816_08635 [Luteibacter flocculans]